MSKKDIKNLTVTITMLPIVVKVGDDLPEDVIEEYLEDGFNREEVIKELKRYSYNNYEIIDYMLDGAKFDVKIE